MSFGWGRSFAIFYAQHIFRVQNYAGKLQKKLADNEPLGQSLTQALYSPPYRVQTYDQPTPAHSPISGRETRQAAADRCSIGFRVLRSSNRFALQLVFFILIYLFSCSIRKDASFSSRVNEQNRIHWVSEFGTSYLFRMKSNCQLHCPVVCITFRTAKCYRRETQFKFRFSYLSLFIHAFLHSLMIYVS